MFVFIYCFFFQLENFKLRAYVNEANMCLFWLSHVKNLFRETRYFLPYRSSYLTCKCPSLVCSFLFLPSVFSRWFSLNLMSLEFSWPRNISTLRNNIFAIHKCFIKGKPQKIYISHCQDWEIFMIWQDLSRQVVWNKHNYFQISIVIWKIQGPLFVPWQQKWE